jgi:hypothetical protein
MPLAKAQMAFWAESIASPAIAVRRAGTKAQRRKEAVQNFKSPCVSLSRCVKKIPAQMLFKIANGFVDRTLTIAD